MIINRALGIVVGLQTATAGFNSISSLTEKFTGSAGIAVVVGGVVGIGYGLIIGRYVVKGANAIQAADEAKEEAKKKAKKKPEAKPGFNP